jgi:KipI family sensor histidine kinase inhibitor
MADPRILPLGEAALLVLDLDQVTVIAVGAALVPALAEGALLDVVPGDGTLLVRFEPTDAAEARARDRLATALAAPGERGPGREVILPVRYGGADGPDLDEVADLVGLTPDEVVAAHVAARHTVAFIGFAPGFPYLHGLPEVLTVPRLAVPRTTTPAGSVAIAEHATGIYPAELPGGWRVIGRTEVPLFDPSADPPTTLQPGDHVRFEAI